VQKLLALAVGDENRRVAHLDPVLSCKTRRSVAGEKDVPAVAQDLERQVDRMAHVLEPGRAARPQLHSFHDPGVKLHDAVKVEARADAGVEERLVFHEPDSSEDGRQGTAGDLGPTGIAGALDGSLPGSALCFRYGPGSAVDDQSRAGGAY
jgi:hypothetical protein